MGEKVEEHENLVLIDYCKEEEAEKTEPAEDEESPQEDNVETSEEIMPQEACQEENQELAQENQVAEEANQEIQEAMADPESLETKDALLIPEGKQEFPLVDERVEQEQEDDGLLRKEEERIQRTEEENADREHEESQDSPLKVETEESEEAVISSEEREEEQEQEEEREATPLLPDCLLLMRCEPKLSMEVSKETWVCTTDFIRWLPERPQPKARADRGDEPKKKKRVGSGDVNPAPAPAQYQPPRWSCSLPAAAAVRVSVAARMEQRVVGAAVGYEPLGLTRCKSEPNRTAAAKLKPESCFWKNRRLEPHSRAAAVGGGAAGVGF